jgi:nucleoid-associated protein YgaU
MGTAVDPNVKLGGPTNPVPAPDQVAQAGSRPIPPLGAPATGTSPPIRVPVAPDFARAPAAAPPTTTQVDSYDEETYLCKAADTFESISTQFYHSPKYAQALLLFNRAHPRRAAALWNDPPQLQDGQPIYIPPLRILERQYGHTIPDVRPLPPVTIPARPGAATGTSLSTPRTGPQYTVRPGDTIWTIARDTLGNTDRWTEIYQLNDRAFDPSRPLTVGAVLVLPSDARLSTSARP